MDEITFGDRGNMADQSTKSSCYHAYKSHVPVNDLANRFGVTRKTIRRWVVEMENQESAGEKSEIEKSEIENREIADTEIENRDGDNREIDPEDGRNQPEGEGGNQDVEKSEISHRKPPRRPLRNIWGSRALSPIYPVNDPELCRNLKQVMKDKGVSVNDLSRACGVSTSAIRSILSCKRMGNIATWIAFSRALGIVIDINSGEISVREGR